MSTFLQLCQVAGRESGVISGNQPTAVTGQTGDLLKLVNWVAESWTWIQQMESNWLWMRKSWSGSLSADNGTYTAASFNITDFGSWITDDVRRRYYPVTIYLTSLGVADEGYVREIDFYKYERLYLRGTQETNKPVHYSISDAQEICFGQIPDNDYTASGKYRQAPVVLAANNDTPACPAQFHSAISWEAARRLAEHDEAWNQAKRCEMERDKILFALRRDQLPRLRFASRPLA